MMLIVLALCLCNALIALAGNTTNTTTIMTLIFEDDLGRLNKTADSAWRQFSSRVTEAENRNLTYLGLNTSLIRSAIEKGGYSRDTYRSLLRNVSDTIVHLDPSICDSLEAEISRTCNGTLWDRMRARKTSNDLARQVKICRSGVSAPGGYTTEKSLTSCLSNTISVNATCYTSARECLAPSLTKRDQMTPQERLMIEGSTEAVLGDLLFVLMVPYGYTTLPLLSAGALVAVGIRDIIQALRMQIAATKNETMVPAPPITNGLDY